MPQVSKKVFSLLSLVCIIFVLKSGAPSQVHAQTPPPISTKYSCTDQPKSAEKNLLNIASYNVGVGDDYKKAAAIAEAFQKYDIDVLSLQELYKYWEKTRDVVVDIPVEFAKRFPGQQFYFYSSLQGSGHSLMIVSKFPILEKSEVEIRGGRKVLQTLLDTPFGKIRIYVTHLQRKDESQCKGLIGALDFINATKTADPSLIMGDYNLMYGEMFAPQKRCGGRPEQELQAGCYGTPCELGGQIDFIFSVKPSEQIIEQHCYKKSLLKDSHNILLSTVKMPGPPLKKGDLNVDKKIDIYDYNVMLEQFGKTGTSGFHPADMVKNGVIDIFDYNELLASYGI